MRQRWWTLAALVVVAASLLRSLLVHRELATLREELAALKAAAGGAAEVDAERQARIARLAGEVEAFNARLRDLELGFRVWQAASTDEFRVVGAWLQVDPEQDLNRGRIDVEPAGALAQALREGGRLDADRSRLSAALARLMDAVLEQTHAHGRLYVDITVEGAPLARFANGRILLDAP